MTPRSAFLAVVTAFAFIPVAAHAQRTGRAAVDAMLRAMGGRDAVLAARTLVMQGTGDNYNLGQNVAPYAPLPRFEVTEFTRTIDFANRRWRHEQVRVPRFVTGNLNPVRQRFAYDGVGWDILPNDSTRRVAARVDIDRADELFHHPIGFLQAALREGTELSVPTARGRLRVMRMNAGGNKFALVYDPRTNLPTAIEKIVYHPLLGDVTLATTFSAWRDADGLKVPGRIAQRLDGQFLLADYRITTARVNGDVPDLASPAHLRSAPAITPPAVSVSIDTLAPGVWYVTGGSHHSVAIEMADHLLLVESPQGDDRTLAVIRRVRELRPNKPLRAVINTHHHFDHAGGIRAAVVEGLTLIAHRTNKPFFENVARRQHFIVQDALAKAPKAARVEGVAGKRVLQDAQRTVELHHIHGSPHAETMLLVYLPAERLLIQADNYNPPAANATGPVVAPFAPNLVENIDRLKLNVDRVVPLHGRLVPIAELREVARNQRAPKGS